MANPALEHPQQVWLVDWWAVKFPKVRLLAIPNGGHRNPIVAAKLKAEGVRPGVPDLFCPEWSLWIETKRLKGGTVSPVQKDWIAYLREIGHTVLVCHGWQDAAAQVSEFARLRALPPR